MAEARLRDAVRAVIVDPDDEEALRRELAEETGLGRFELGPLVWRRTHLSWEQLNAEYVTAIRWWTLAELEAADAQLAPRRLRDLVRDLLAELPSEPVDVGV